MSKFTVRHEVEVEICGVKHKMLVNELPYQKFMDINSGVGLPEERKGFEMVRALCVLSFVEPDGSPTFTDESFLDETQSAIKELYHAALRVHGIDVGKVTREAQTPEQVEGNE